MVGVDGNAFSVIGYTSKAMRRSKFTSAEISAYRKKAISGDYNNVLSVSMDQIDKVNKRNGN